MGALSVAVIGGYLTQLDEWYFSLIQPNWKPPDWAFGPIWTSILVLCAVSAGLCYKKAVNDQDYQKKLIYLFVLNAILNVTWSLLYFYLKRPDIALFQVIFLWSSILLLILHTRKYSNFASLIIYPYLLWVSIATVLNYQTVVLNGPFI
jgi:tryptophan-rich sensory protein